MCCAERTTRYEFTLAGTFVVMLIFLVARNLERVADLATNIAEEVVFIHEAKIIKHHADEAVGEDFGRS